MGPPYSAAASEVPAGVRDRRQAVHVEVGRVVLWRRGRVGSGHVARAARERYRVAPRFALIEYPSALR